MWGAIQAARADHGGGHLHSSRRLLGSRARQRMAGLGRVTAKTMRVLRVLPLIVPSVLGIASAARAAEVVRYLNVHLDESLIGTAQDNLGNNGEQFRFDVNVEPFALEIGDTIKTHVSFDHVLAIRDTGDGYWGSPSIGESLEWMISIYWFVRPGNGSATISATTDLRIVAGDPALETAVEDAESGGTGIAVQYLFKSLTDSTFSISGYDISSTVLDYKVTSGNGDFSSFAGQIYAGDLSVTEIAEPATLALVGASLFGVAATRRRRRRLTSA